MAHVNRQVRDAVAAALLANTSLDTVSTNRSQSLVDSELPAGIVGTGLDQVSRFSKGKAAAPTTPLELRTIELTLVAVIEGESDTVDDDLDALRVEIEPEVVTALASLAIRVQHTGSELDMGTDEDGERWYGFLALSWEVDVITAVGDPETALT